MAKVHWPGLTIGLRPSDFTTYLVPVEANGLHCFGWDEVSLTRPAHYWSMNEMEAGFGMVKLGLLPIREKWVVLPSTSSDITSNI